MSNMAALPTTALHQPMVLLHPVSLAAPLRILAHRVDASAAVNFPSKAHLIGCACSVFPIRTAVIEEFTDWQRLPSVEHY